MRHRLAILYTVTSAFSPSKLPAVLVFARQLKHARRQIERLALPPISPSLTRPRQHTIARLSRTLTQERCTAVCNTLTFLKLSQPRLPFWAPIKVSHAVALKPSVASRHSITGHIDTRMQIFITQNKICVIEIGAYGKHPSSSKYMNTRIVLVHISSIL